MMLRDLIQLIDDYKEGNPLIGLVVPNDIFRLNTLADVTYPVLGWTQGQHRLTAENGLLYFSLTVFYVDRLLADKSNELDIQSAGVAVLTDLVHYLEDRGAFVYGDVTFTPFNQRFTDECAGVYASITFELPAEVLCSPVSM